MITIEIYNKASGEVSETKTFETERQYKAFRFYFSMQCNTQKWAYREVEK